MSRPAKTPPTYAVASVDHALRIATMLQLEGALSVAEVAERLGVARSTAHRLLAMLVYRDFAVQDEDRAYRAGPILELAAHSQSQTSRVRLAALPHLHQLVAWFGESVNLAIRAGDTARFIASVESTRALRVGSREGMVFAAHETTAGLLLLAELTPEELAALYAQERFATRPGDRPDLARLKRELTRIRRAGFAVNQERSERGVIAVGVPVHGPDGRAVAGIAVSMPTARYHRAQLPTLVAALRAAAAALEAELGGEPPRTRAGR